MKNIQKNNTEDVTKLTTEQTLKNKLYLIFHEVATFVIVATKLNIMVHFEEKSLPFHLSDTFILICVLLADVFYAATSINMLTIL